MSTFYGGPQLASVLSVQGSVNNPSFTVPTIAYTVPAGFNAHIKGTYTHNSTDSTIALIVNGVVVTRSYVATSESFNDKEKDADLFLPSGATIGFIRSDANGQCKVSWYFGIQLYKNP